MVLEKLDRLFSRIPKPYLIAATVPMVTLLSALGYFVGADISLSIFYLVPVGIVTWYAGRSNGLVFALISAIASLSAQYAEPDIVDRSRIVYWNGCLQLGFFVVVVLLLDALWSRLDLARRLARTDSLTGQVNRRAFMEQVEYVIGLAARGRQPVTLAYIDLDNFKQVNDTYGHGEGDRVLQLVAGSVTHSVRRTDIFGRLGGDEFALLLPHTDRAGAEFVLDNLRKVLLAMLANERPQVTCSIGAVTYKHPPASADEAIGAADSLMYEVKRQGKNAIAFLEIDPRLGTPTPSLHQAAPSLVQ